MQLYHMNCTIPGDDLYRLKDGRFQFLRSYETAPLMHGADSGGVQYVLADKKLASFLQSLDLDQVSFQPVVLWNRKSDEEIHTHSLVSIGRCVEESQVAHIELDGYQLCSIEPFSKEIFVSGLLKEALENAGFEYLQFREGCPETRGL